MIPNVKLLTSEITKTGYPNKTYRIVLSEKNVVDDSPTPRGITISPDSADDRISGYADDLDSVIQAVYLILSSERYQFNIYSWDYGVELIDLFGKPMPYVMAVLPRRIREALTQDNRIKDVVDFTFEKHGKKLHTTFTVVTNTGNISTGLEVSL